MFEPNETITEYVDALFAACRTLKRGETLTHEVIGGILGCAPHTEHWTWCMAKLRRRMEAERGVTLWSEREVGYRLLLPSEQLDVPLRRQRRALRQIRRGTVSLDALPEKLLTGHQRRVRAVRLDQSAAMARAVRRGMRDQVLAARATPTNPRPRPLPVPAPDAAARP